MPFEAAFSFSGGTFDAFRTAEDDADDDDDEDDDDEEEDDSNVRGTSNTRNTLSSLLVSRHRPSGDQQHPLRKFEW